MKTISLNVGSLQRLAIRRLRSILEVLPWLLLERSQWIYRALFALAALVCLWVVFRLLFIAPPQPVLTDTPAVKQLATEMLDELELVIEQRQQEYETPLRLPRPEIYVRH